jgi:murein DD-endopeptidase MepM/ murein hydrolase activator NlpD
MPEARVVDVERPVLRDTLGALLARAGVGGESARAVVSALAPVADPRRLRPLDRVSLRLVAGQVARLALSRDRDDGAPETVLVTPDGNGGFQVTTATPDVSVEVARLSGTVRGSLYESLVSRGEQPALINAFVEVFDSQVDFYREVQNGDTFKALVEKRYVGGRFIGYGRVLAAEYRQAARTIRGFHHQARDGSSGHFDEGGRSLLTAFLKTPMEFTRITSRYGMRLHPVLKEHKHHNGVDYGAPKGTPVWTVADGRVTVASYQGACGNQVLVQHGNGVVTGYCHLSRFGAGIRVGARVTQKQVVGYVGNTGRSTGPHLHFLVTRDGHHVNPSKLESPRKAALHGEERERFRAAARGLAAELDAVPTA